MRDLLFAIVKLIAPYILPVGMARNFDMNESSTIDREKSDDNLTTTSWLTSNNLGMEVSIIG